MEPVGLHWQLVVVAALDAPPNGHRLDEPLLSRQVLALLVLEPCPFPRFRERFWQIMANAISSGTWEVRRSSANVGCRVRMAI